MAEQERPWWAADEAPQNAGSTVITAPPPLPVIPATPPPCDCSMCTGDDGDLDDDEPDEEACNGPDNETHEYRCTDCNGKLTSGQAPDDYAWDTCDHDWSCPDCDHCESDQHDCQECEAVRDCDHTFQCDQCEATWSP